MAESSKALCSQSQQSPKNVSSPPSFPPAQQGSLSNMEREYEFFVTTAEPHQPEGVERGLIRRLVMRNFFETKLVGPQTNVSENNSASTVMAKKQLKNRFRLSKMGEEGNETKSKKNENKQEDTTETQRKPRTRRQDSGATEASQIVYDKRSRKGSRSNSVVEDEETKSQRKKSSGKGRDKALILKVNPSTHRFDPFDVLPVPGSPQLDTLFKLFASGSRINSIAINAKSTWWPFISNDAGLMHAALATWALYGMLVKGLNDLRLERLRHKNEAIKEINYKIGKPSGNISDELVGTVLTLASFESLLGAYDAAQLHLAALKRMVLARGGLCAFSHNDGLVRGIIWVDFATAAAFHTSPSFPQVCLDQDTPPLPDMLLEVAACTSPTSLLQLSLAAVDCFNIFYRLHRLALAASSYWLHRVERLTLSNLLYETQFLALSVPDYSRVFLDFDLEEDHEQTEQYLHRKKMADATSVVEGLLAATQIFMYAVLREVPTKARIFNILLTRLHVAIDRPNTSVIDVWRRERNLNMLLWVLVVACSIVPAGEGRTWWILRLSEVLADLQLSSQIHVEVVLKSVAWTDTFFNGKLGEMLKEVSQSERLEGAVSCGAALEQGLTKTVEPQMYETEFDRGYDENLFNVPMEYMKVSGE